jgi:DNA polymerase/3'-5' exonuclease PolX
MSTNDKRWPAQQAMAVAAELMERLQARCERIVVAGSLRRGKQFVGDVELLFIPRMGERQKGLFATEPFSLADECIAEMLDAGILRKRPSKIGGFTWGESNKLAIHAASGIPVDLFSTTSAKWWVSLVVRTGSLETNMKLTTGAQRLHRSLNAYGEGVTNEDGSKTAATSERDVFDLCGISYLEPKAR